MAPRIGPSFGPSVKLKRSYVQTAEIAILWAQNIGPKIGPSFGLRSIESPPWCPYCIRLLSCSPSIELLRTIALRISSVHFPCRRCMRECWTRWRWIPGTCAVDSCATGTAAADGRPSKIDRIRMFPAEAFFAWNWNSRFGDFFVSETKLKFGRTSIRGTHSHVWWWCSCFRVAMFHASLSDEKNISLWTTCYLWNYK